MNKTRLTLMIVGGVCVVAALVLGYLVFDASSAKSEGLEALEDTESMFQKLVKAPVYPGAASLAAVESNRVAYTTWTDENLQLAKKGDKYFPDTTAPAFKTAMVTDAQRLANLPGRAAGKLVREGFAFGFPQYVTGGDMPPAEDLKRLQREWDDVTTVVTLLADAGAVEVSALTLTEPQDLAPKAAAKPGAKKPVKPQPNKAAKAGADAAPTAEKPAITAMQLEFVVHAQGLVNVLNALAGAPRFCLVEDLRFARERDELSEALGGNAKQDTTQRSSRRRRRGGEESAAPTAEAGAQDHKGQPVVDAVNGDLIKVNMTVSVLDFNTAVKPVQSVEPEQKEVTE